MPTYEYECKKCGHTFEVFQAMSDEPLKICTECKGEVRRLIFGGAGVIFKGSGFYVTDKASGKSSGSNKTKSTTETKATESADAAKASTGGATPVRDNVSAGNSKAEPATQSA